MFTQQGSLYVGDHAVFVTNNARKCVFLFLKLANKVTAQFFFDAFGYIAGSLEIAKCFYVFDVHFIIPEFVIVWMFQKSLFYFSEAGKKLYLNSLFSRSAAMTAS